MVEDLGFMELGLTWVLGFGLDVCPLVVWDSGDIMWDSVDILGISCGYSVDILGILCGILWIFWGYYMWLGWQ